MQKEDIKNLTSEELLQTDTFNFLFAEKNDLKRSELEELLKLRAKDLKIAKSFGKLLKDYKIHKIAEMRNKGGHQTKFSEQPLVLNCGEWICDDNGVYKLAVDGNGGYISRTASPFPIMITEILKNIDTDLNKLRISFYRDEWKSITVNASTVASNSKIVELADYGVPVNSSNAKWLVEYLGDLIALNEGFIPQYDTVGHLGWIEGEFVPYNDMYKFDGQNEFKFAFESVTSKGDYKKWLEHTKELRKNIIMRLAIDTSFASVIIEKVGTLPFILHLWGETAFGKTVTAMVAASVWGNPVKGGMWRSMNNTINYSMTISGFFRNLPVIFDELQTIKNSENSYDKLIMSLTEGINRGRMSYNKIEKTEEWSCAFIFCGEENITKENSGGGSKNRVIEIECTEKLISDGNKTATLVTENYGHAGKWFIETISNSDDYLKENYKRYYKEIIEKADTTEKQAMAMAVILLADEILTGPLFYDGEKPLTVEDVKPFMMSKFEVDISERAMDYTNDLIAVNSNRFDATFSGEIWGRFEDNYVYINKTILMRELSAKGFEFDAVKRKWFNNGYLVKNSQGKFFHCTKCNGIKACYIKLNITDISKSSTEKPPF